LLIEGFHLFEFWGDNSGKLFGE